MRAWGGMGGGRQKQVSRVSRGRQAEGRWQPQAAADGAVHMHASGSRPTATDRPAAHAAGPTAHAPQQAQSHLDGPGLAAKGLAELGGDGLHRVREVVGHRGQRAPDALNHRDRLQRVVRGGRGVRCIGSAGGGKRSGGCAQAAAAQAGQGRRRAASRRTRSASSRDRLESPLRTLCGSSCHACRQSGAAGVEGWVRDNQSKARTGTTRCASAVVESTRSSQTPD